MKALPHRYDVRLAGGSSRYITGSADGLPTLRMAPPPQYDGPGDAWSPEHLLLASVGGCFVFTLRAVAALSKVELGLIDVAVQGTLDRQNGVTRFTEIVLRPTLTIAPAADRARVIGMLEKAERNCLVSASLSTPIKLEPAIRGASTEFTQAGAA